MIIRVLERQEVAVDGGRLEEDVHYILEQRLLHRVVKLPRRRRHVAYLLESVTTLVMLVQQVATVEVFLL